MEDIKNVNLSVRFKVNPTNVAYIVADINYTNIYYVQGGMDTIAVSLKKVEETLKNRNFYRISKSMMVNKDYVQSIERLTKKTANLVLFDNRKAAVSRRKMRLLKIHFKNI